jgi:cGMP-dependent protein kinase
VQLVQHVGHPHHFFALKRVDFATMTKLGQRAALQAELDVVSTLSHHCIEHFVKTFETPTAAYFLTEFLSGGDLFNAIREIGTLEKQHAHFYSACITLALEHLHEKNIMYRDLKPENVMLDSHGNAKLIDFGCCKQAREASTLVGTNEYMAPEAILRRTYTNVVDWWALGVMLHEFVVGPLPFGSDGQSRQEIFHEILHAPLQYLDFVSDESATSAIASLLEREPRQRLGNCGAAEVKQHAYFAGFDWEAFEQGMVKPPWLPNTSQFSAQWEEVNDDNV